MKWEYCAIKGIYSADRPLKPVYPAVWYFTSAGIQVVEIKGKEDAEVAKMIAQLGEQGWEMVGAGNVTESVHALYFKRQKP